MSVLLTSCYETSFDEAEFKLNQGSCLRPSPSNVLSKTAVFLQKVQVIWSDASSERKYKYATNNSGATTASAGFLTHAFTTRQTVSTCDTKKPQGISLFHNGYQDTFLPVFFSNQPFLQRTNAFLFVCSIIKSQYRRFLLCRAFMIVHILC